MSSSPMRGPCARKSQKSAGVKGSPPKALLSVWDISPPKPTPGLGEEGECSSQVFMRSMPPSSTEVRLVEPLRSCSVAGSSKRDRSRRCRLRSFAVLECVVKRGVELEPSLDSGAVIPHYALQCLAVRE